MMGDSNASTGLRGRNISLELSLRQSFKGQEKERLLEQLKSLEDFPNSLEDLKRLDPDIAAKVNKVEIFTADGEITNFIEAKDTVMYKLYKLHTTGGEAEHLDEEDEGSSVHASQHWLMPNKHFEGLWETLIYDHDVKASLLNYARTTMLMAERNVNSNLVSWNKVLLLHGPPGTGKTSLCSALAHRLTILMSDKYSYGQLIDINSHSLFSKWFSESGKLVQRMFDSIRDMVDDPKALVCVLVDEVESLAAARSGNSNDPGDAVRVVNAVLTQLDELRRYPNVLIFTTSNLTGSLDLAFVDRADMKKYIGLPSSRAIAQMLVGSINELIASGIVVKQGDGDHSKTVSALDVSVVSEECRGFSGRTIRRIPFLTVSSCLNQMSVPIPICNFLKEMVITVKEYQKDIAKIEK